MTETRYHIEELRLEGRLLRGVAVRYGDVAKLPWGVSERIASGAFDSSDVILNVMHDRSRPLARTGGGLRLSDSPSELRIEADLPETREAEDALALIRSKVYRGLSVEFVARKEAQEGRTRIIERAKLVGVALVDTPAYPDSVVTAMRARFGAQEAPRAARRRFYL